MVFRRENLTKLANFLVISKSIICKKAAISMIYRFLVNITNRFIICSFQPIFLR